jgi:hypothetical protein
VEILKIPDPGGIPMTSWQGLSNYLRNMEVGEQNDINLRIRIDARQADLQEARTILIDVITAAARMISQIVIRIEVINGTSIKVAEQLGKRRTTIDIYGLLPHPTGLLLIERGIRDIIRLTFHRKFHQVKFQEEISRLRGAIHFLRVIGGIVLDRCRRCHLLSRG